ncbi:MAG: phosphopantetheinyl transferase [Gammaproteobacteria bacterium PRO9]|nr:phosphopantetheinyl transferase [Gammaproteobacteria bacterium PRO9]
MSPELLERITESLKAALPAGTAFSLGPIATDHPPLMGEELPRVRDMAAKRRGEFMAGRAHARAALAALGLPPLALPMGADRAPAWPPGIVGSISHAGDLVVAVAAPARLLHGIGIDVEPATPLDEDLLERVCRPEELARIYGGNMHAPNPGPSHLAKLIFSAKESVYKCIAPRTGIFLEFGDVEILLDPHRPAFSVQGHDAARGHLGPGLLSGRIVELGGYWITATWQAA